MITDLPKDSKFTRLTRLFLAHSDEKFKRKVTLKYLGRELSFNELSEEEKELLEKTLEEGALKNKEEEENEKKIFIRKR